MMKGGGFDAIVIGSKPKMPEKSDESEDETEDKGEGFGNEAFHMASRAVVKALGVDREGVDMKKFDKALKAAIVACVESREEEGDDY